MSNPYGPPGGRPPGYGMTQPAGGPYPHSQQPHSGPQGAPGSYGQQQQQQTYAQAPYYAHGTPYPGYAQRPPADPDKTRRSVGLVLFILAMLAGLVLNIAFQFLEIFSNKHPARMMDSVITGTICATLPLGVYLFVPAVIDRFDPEPWWCLMLAFLWGAVVATGFAGFVNTMVSILSSEMFGRSAGEFVTAVISAPICEEFMKGLAVLFAFYFLRREFDGVVDGIIYATFCALGFACVENISYYARADMAHKLGATFFLRGMLAPWGHPLYTSMTGIGFGIARETEKTWLRYTAPLFGYCCGVTLHAIWNFVPTALGDGAFLLMLPLWILFVLAFFVIIIVLVMRKGKVIREHLRDEVLLGNLSQEEVELITSPVGRLKCTFSWRGKTGRDFIRAGARLALSKWHTARAMRGRKMTISADFIVPLRQELARLRAQMMARTPRYQGAR